jgi:hypothetical protein
LIFNNLESILDALFEISQFLLLWTYYLISKCIFMKKFTYSSNFVWLLIFFGGFVLNSNYSLSQSAIIIAPADAGVCNATNFQATIQGLQPNSNFRLRIETRIEFPLISGRFEQLECLEQSSQQISPGLTGDPIFSIFISDPNFISVPTNDNYSFEWDITNPTSLSEITFDYAVTIDCNVLSEAQQNATISMFQNWIFDPLIIMPFQTIPINGATELQTNVIFPFFEDVRDYSAAANIYYANYLGANATNIKDLYFEYANNHNYPANAIVRLQDTGDDVGSPCESSYGIPVFHYAIVLGTTIAENIPANDWIFYTENDEISVDIPYGSKIVFREQVNVIGCECNQGMVLFTWKCDPNNINLNNECSECQKRYLSPFEIKRNGTYDVVLTCVNPIYAHREYDHSCANTNTGWDYVISNQGDNAAANVFFELYYGKPVDVASLELIDLNSITFTLSGPGTITFATAATIPIPISGPPTIINCPSCFSYPNPAFIAPLCTSAVSTPIKSLQFAIIDLLPGQSCTIHFDMYRCIENNDALLNIEKHLNLWTSGISGKNECNSGFSVPGGGWLSGEGVQSTNMDLKLFMFPTTHNLTAWPPIDPLTLCPQGAPYSSSTDFADNKVLLNGLFFGTSQWHGYGILGGNNNGYIPSSGMLRIKIHTQKGLLVEDDLTFHTTLNVGASVLSPINNTPINTQNGCDDTDYYYYFDLGDLPMGITVKNLFDQGRLNFRLLPCCTSSPTSTYDVSFHLLVDPIGAYPGCLNNLGYSGGNYNAITLSNFAALNNNSAWLPLSQVDDLINVQCPGCRAPGIIVDSYRMLRSDFSLGLPDFDNDRIADAVTQIDPALYVPPVPINYASSMHGDLIEDRMEAHFQDGSIEGPVDLNGVPCDNSIIGYEYSQMGVNSLDVLELRRLFSNNALVQMGLEVQSITAYVDIPCSNCPASDCVDCPIPSSFHTQVKYDYTANAGTNPYTLNGNTLLLTFHASDFISAPPGATLLPTSNPLFSFSLNQFEPNQRYRIIVRYSVCGNFESINDPDHGVLKTIIDNTLYLSGTTWSTIPPSMPNNETELNIATPSGAPGWTSNPLNTQFSNISDPTFPDNFAYYCETGSGGHSFISNEYSSTLQLSQKIISLQNGCDRIINFSSSSTIGGGSNFDYFPSEIRRPRFVPNQWTFEAPNLGINSIQSSTINEYGTSAFNLSSSTINTTTSYNCLMTPACTLDVSSLTSFVPDISAFISPTQSNLAIGDQKFTLKQTFNVDVGGIQNDCNLSGYLKVSGFFAENNIDYYSTQPNPISCTNLPNLIPAVHTPEALNQTIKPNLSLNFGSAQPTVSNFVEWTFVLSNLQNIPPDPQDITDAFNVFLNLNSALPFLDNIVVNITSGAPPATIVLNQFNQGIIFSVLPVGTTVSGTIHAHYAECIAQDPTLGYIPIDLNWGWDCDGLPPPTNQLNNVICQSEHEILSIINTFTAFELHEGPTPNYNLCDNYLLNPSFTSIGQGHLFPIDFSLNNMPPGFSVVGIPTCSINHNGTVTPITLIPTVNNTWSFQNNPELSINDILELEINFHSSCEYNGFLPQIYINVEKYCGTSIPIVANYTGVLTMDDNFCTGCFTITKTPSTLVVPVGVPLDYFITICNNNPSTAPPVTSLVTDNFPLNFNLTQSNIPLAPLPFPAASQCTTYTVSGSYNAAGNYTNQANLYVDPDVNNLSPMIATADVSVADCNAFANVITTIPGHNQSSSYTIPNGSIVYLVEDFEIDQSVQYSNCTFYAAPGIEIIVKSPNVLGTVTLTLEGSKLYACSNMWKGIRVEPQGTLKSADSEISDAEYAIYAEDRTTILLQNTNFYRNYIGLYIPTASTGLNSISTYISNCEFATHGTIRSTYPGQQTVPGIKSLTGIQVHDVFLDLGSIYNPNRFCDMSNGIITVNTSISVTNCIFKDILPDPQYQFLTGSMASNTSYNGSGIYAIGRYGSILKQRGFGMNGQPSFVNCRFGMFADRMNVDSRDNYMTSMTSSNQNGMMTGYRVSFGSNLTTDITGNKIESRSTAIDLRFNDNARHLWVSDNIIFFGESNAGSSRGISAIQAIEQNGANRDSRIHNNEIYYNPGANTAANGINLISTSDFFVTENNLVMDDNLVNANGILVSGSNNTEISCNVVDGSNNFNAPVRQSAITHVLGSRPTIACNIVDGTMNGIRMTGDAGLNVTIQGNEFNNHNRGLFYNQGVTNGQDRRGNLWLTSPVNLTLGAFSDNPQIAGISPYYYDNIHPSAPTGKTFEPTTTTSNPFGYDPDTWFIFEDDQIDNLTFHCLVNIDHYCDQFPPCAGCPIDIVIHERIARDSIENAPYTAETLWRLRRELYRELHSDSSLLSITMFYDFYIEMEASVTAQLEQLNGEQYELMQLDQSVINNLNQNRNILDIQMVLLSEQIELYRQALDAGSDPSLYLQNIQNSNLTIETVITYNKNVFAIADSSLILTAENIKMVNESIYASATIEENEKVVNEIYLSFVGRKQFQFSQDTIEQLESIASQCPLSGGNAVFRARAILSLINDELVYDDVNICLQAGIILKQTPKKPTAHLYPNPANSSVTQVYEIPENTEAEFQLFNSMGQRQLSFTLIQGNTTVTFSTESLKPGIYHYRIASIPENLLTGKLVIIH